MLLDIAEGLHAHCGLQPALGDVDQGIQFRAVVLTAIVFIPRRKQITKGQRVVVIGSPAGQNDVELTGGHFRQPLLENLLVDFCVNT